MIIFDKRVYIMIIHNEDQLSDEEMTELLIQAAKDASAKAVKRAEAHGSPIQYVEDGKLYERTADGKVRFIEDMPRVKSPFKYKVGEKICVNLKH